MNIAQLRSLRKARGLKQMQLGAALGVGQTRIARIESDPTAVSVEQFLALLGALGVQMVLRSNRPDTVVGLPADAATSTKSTQPALTSRRQHDEPW